tara:strand:- start:555 stop:734 length:180 start_codon:yes stop_codon:yes gene_type:complete
MKNSKNKLKLWAIGLSSSAFAVITLGEVFTGGELIFLPLGIVSAITAGLMYQNLDNLNK